MDRTKIGERLRELRMGRKQSDIANVCGIRTQTYSMYETGKRLPRDDVKTKLAEYFGTTVQKIFFEE